MENSKIEKFFAERSHLRSKKREYKHRQTRAFIIILIPLIRALMIGDYWFSFILSAVIVFFLAAFCAYCQAKVNQYSLKIDKINQKIIEELAKT